MTKMGLKSFIFIHTLSLSSTLGFYRYTLGLGMITHSVTAITHSQKLLSNDIKSQWWLKAPDGR